MLNKSSILHKTLARALSMMRPHDSEGTKRLTKWLKANAPAHARVSVDEAGNLHIDARVSSLNRTLFVAHVDTVHRNPGPNKIRKTATHWHAKGAPLGADDGAGAAMLMHLLHSGVDAYYVFTQGEECGGIGASFLAKEHAALLTEFDRAIAFDRRGIDSVITHQGGCRCCSDAFAQSLADALNDDLTLMYLPDDTGVYTDTAEFVDVIPECTNISVGYYNEHSDRESLDIVHLAALAERVVKIDWDSLPTERDPSVRESKWGRWSDWTYDWSTSWSKADSLYKWHNISSCDDEEWLREDLREAIYDALKGDKQWLVELMAESVYPEDPVMAVQCIDRKRLTDELLSASLDDVETFSPSTVMCYMFDHAHKES